MNPIRKIGERIQNRGHLVLSRKVGESIVVDLPHGDECVVTVASVKGDRVRLHLAAPREVPIRRSELTPRGRAA